MKVARIALKNFRAYENAEIVFDEPLSIIRGANHKGKSSIAQALQLALSRRADGTDARGAGASDKIRQGQKKAEIEVDIETARGPVALEVGITASGRTQKLSVEAFASHLIDNGPAWAAVLDPKWFVAQKPEDQKALLAALVVPTSAEFDPAMVELTNKHFEGVEWDQAPTDLIDQMYKRAFDARREAKIVLEHIQIPATPNPPDYTVEQIEEYLGKLREQIEHLPKAAPAPPPASAVDLREIGRLESDLKQKQRELAEARQDLESAKERIADCDKQMLTGPQQTKFKKVADGEARFESLQSEIARETREQEDNGRSIETLKSLADRGQCPTCGQSIQAEHVASITTLVQQHIADSEQRVLDLQREQKDLGDIQGAKAKLAEHERAKESKLNWVKRQTANSEAITAIGKEIVAFTDRLNELREASAPAAAPEPVATDTVAKELSTKLEAWTIKLTEAKRYATICEHIKRETTRQAEQKEVVADLERLCTYFGKDGIKAQLIQKHLSDFEDSINGVLSAWEYAAELSIEPYRFNVTTAENKTLPLKELSESERLMFGIALQAAVSVHAKIRLLVIDAADTFINGERGRLFSGLRDLLESELLDQAIVLVSDDRTEVPDQPGVAFYRVAQGKVERLGPQREEEAA